MNADDWKRLRELFHGALEQAADERDAWLASECDAPDLLRQLREMLAADAEPSDPGEEMVTASLQSLADNSHRDVGKSLGPWRIIEELGRGGMGSVFLAERADDEYRRQVALKLIRGFPDAASLERLRAERQILADLNHPNISAMIDGGTTDDGQPYLVMEYVDGVAVDQWCGDRRLSPGQRVTMFREICSGVRYAHANLVIHRDLKPSNVLVTAEGRPVLLDFGIAKLMQPSAADKDPETGPTTRGPRYYTPGYSSPEQLSGAPVTIASDVYSLGKLLAALLAAGRAESDPMPRDLAAIIERATAEEVAERYSSVESLDADLANYLEGRPVQAASRRLGYRAWKFIKRHRLAVGAAAFAVVVMTGMVGQILLESQRSRAAERQAQIEARNAEQVLGFLIGLIESAAPAQARGESVTVFDVFEEGRKRISPEAIADPALRARTLFALGSVYRALEEHVVAQELLAESARLARQLGDVEAEVRALNVLGMSAVLSTERDVAAEALRRSVELVRSHPGIDPGERASAINNLGLMLLEFDDRDRGRELIAEALEIREEAGLAEERIATSYHNLAEAEDLLGNHREAMRLYRKALEIKERTIGRMHPSYANSLHGLGLAASKIGEWNVRRESVEQQLEIRTQLFGPDAPVLHRDYNELANLHHDMGRYTQAIEAYNRARELDAAAVGGASNEWLLANNIGAAFKDLGMPERAEQLYRESVSLRTERFGDDSTNTARARHNLASVILEQGRPGEACAIADRALAVRLRDLGEAHPESIATRFLSVRIDHASDPLPDRLERMAELIEEWTAASSETSSGVLQARSVFGRALLDDRQLAHARTELESTIDHYRTQLVEDHPLAAALELELVRLDLLEDRAESARARLEAQRQTLLQSFPESSRYRRQLGCLERGEQDPACWR